MRRPNFLSTDERALGALPLDNLRPIDQINGYAVRPGLFLDYGTVVLPGGVSFTVHSNQATQVTLVLYERGAKEPTVELPFPESYHIGDVYSMIVFGLDIEEFEYTYRVEGPYDPEKGLLFDGKRELIDPYARAVVGQSRWGERPFDGFRYRARVVASQFDWGDDTAPDIPIEDLVIYELHVRGFTKHETSGVTKPGTYRGLIEKIPYLKKLGINAVELMPIFEFDEMLGAREHEGKQLVDYWGYNPISFFANNTSYTAELEHNREGTELKELIRTLHENDMEVILDVVFNHTAEGNEHGPVISFKGFDNQVYYMLTPDGYYYNFSGCGNTVNANHPVVQNMILESLRYWVTEYRVDGFRFDLASILGRNVDGNPMENPPIIRMMAYDPILSQVKLIAEAWDAAGLYQVGSFPNYSRWSEWNGKYRDDLRRFLKGDPDSAGAAALRITGSTDLYDPLHRTGASVNFITCHDGFTLRDLYSYNEKHNFANGWNNTDGENHNNSWNCGTEGDTDDAGILALRDRMVKNAVCVLLASHGTPMLLSGDEFGNTQFGNNNPYCQDNEISWLDWSLLRTYEDRFQFVQKMIEIRKAHPVLRKVLPQAHCGLRGISLHGAVPYAFRAEENTHMLGILYSGHDTTRQKDDVLYLAMNMYWEPLEIELPALECGCRWAVLVNTGAAIGAQIGAGIAKADIIEGRIRLAPRSVILLEGTPG